MKNLTETQIEEAFAPHKEAAARWFEDHVRQIWLHYADEDGIISGETRKNARRFRGFEYQKWALIRRFFQSEGYGRYEPVTINEEYLQREAKKFGQEQVAAFVAKLQKKLGDLEVAKVTRAQAGAGEFEIHGEIEGCNVHVEQQRVFKMSKNGKLYCQWPARIYVNGKFTSAKDYKDRFGG